MFQWWRTPHGQHLGSKGKNMDIKHIFNRTDFLRRRKSCFIYRCLEADVMIGIALGQTFFFVVKKTPTVFEFWDLGHPPPKKKKTTCRFCCFCCNQSQRRITKKSTPPVFRFSFCCFRTPRFEVEHQVERTDWMGPSTQIVGWTNDFWRSYVPPAENGAWYFFVTLILEKGDKLLTKVWPKIVCKNCPKKIRGVSPGCFCYTYEITPACVKRAGFFWLLAGFDFKGMIL